MRFPAKITLESKVSGPFPGVDLALADLLKQGGGGPMSSLSKPWIYQRFPDVNQDFKIEWTIFAAYENLTNS
jgi:hypothetical protein